MKMLMSLWFTFFLIPIGFTQSGSSKLSGVWYDTETKQTVLIYPQGSNYHMVWYDLDKHQVIGDRKAQLMHIRSDKFQKIGMDADQRPVSAKVKFDGLDQIKTKGVFSQTVLKLVLKLDSKQCISMVQEFAGNSKIQSAVSGTRSTAAKMQHLPGTDPYKLTGIQRHSNIATSPVANLMPLPAGFGGNIPLNQSLPTSDYHGKIPMGTHGQNMHSYPASYQLCATAPEAPKEKKETGKKILKGLGAALSIAATLGLVKR